MTTKIHNYLNDTGFTKHLPKFFLYCIIFLLPLVIWYGTFYRSAIKDFLSETTALICLILLFLPYRKNFITFVTVPFSKSFMFAILFLFMALISLIFSCYRNFGIHNLPPLITAIFLFYTASTVIDKKSLEHLSHIWLISACIFSIYSILRFSKLIQTPSLIGNPNLEAGYLILTIPLAMSHLVFEYERWCRLKEVKTRNIAEIYGFAVILLSIAIAITISRGATIGLIAGIFTLCLCFKKSGLKSIISRKFRIISLTLAVLITAGFILLIPIIKRGDTDSMGTLGVRLRIWKATAELIKEKPITGWGFGTFILSYGHYGTPTPFSLDIPRHAHCEPLQVFSEMGIPGFLIFLLLFYFFFRESFKILKAAEPHQQIILAGFISGISALLFHNLVSVNLRYSCSLILIWIAMGVVLSQGKNKKIRVPGIFSIVLIVLSIFLWKNFSLDKFRSQYHLAMGMRYSVSEKLGEKRFDKALGEFDRAFILNNTEYIAKWMKAQVYEHRKKYKMAIEELIGFEKIFPEFGQLHGKLGDLYIKVGMEDKAIKEFRHAIKLTPYVVDNHISLGKIYFNKKMYEDALKIYNDALKLGLIHSAIYNNIGNIYFANFQFDKAFAFYKIAHNLSPEDEGILYNMKQAEAKKPHK